MKFHTGIERERKREILGGQEGLDWISLSFKSFFIWWTKERQKTSFKITDIWKKFIMSLHI